MILGTVTVNKYDLFSDLWTQSEENHLLIDHKTNKLLLRTENRVHYVHTFRIHCWLEVV